VTPKYPKPPISTSRIAFHIFVVGGDRLHIWQVAK